MSRADTAEGDRTDFFAFIDEFSSFTTDAFSSAFSEARKYRLALTVATQFLDQLDELTRASMFGNVGTTVVFQVSQRDAEILAQELGGGLLPADLLTLPKYQAYVRLLTNGVPSTPFSVRTLPPAKCRGDEQAIDTLRRTSRHRYTKPVRQVEGHLVAALS
ncbi:MAG: TraM recognition domain-containing protein [Pirellulales bacterium]